MPPVEVAPSSLATAGAMATVVHLVADSLLAARLRIHRSKQALNFPLPAKSQVMLQVREQLEVRVSLPVAEARSLSDE